MSPLAGGCHHAVARSGLAYQAAWPSRVTMLVAAAGLPACWKEASCRCAHTHSSPTSPAFCRRHCCTTQHNCRKHFPPGSDRFPLMHHASLCSITIDKTVHPLPMHFHSKVLQLFLHK